MQANRLVLNPELSFNAVKVMSATTHVERARLSERVTEWIASNPANSLCEIVISQSSDSAFHCIAFTLFYRTPAAA
jgi:hypothetical protein